ncbi:RNA dependent RNA polymerase-domain-containing protein [Gaertneriomyces semiglobifer]|nr:RNA dependent RNA polymerase-domain-containing protein [Gaertneriomyces semiglobifer]
MEIFIGNVSYGLQEKQLRRALQGPLSTFGIRAFHIQIIKKKNIAFLTVPTLEQGQQFLEYYGASNVNARRQKKQIQVMNQYLRMNQSNKRPADCDKALLRSLELQQQQRDAQQRTASIQTKKKRSFSISGFEVGRWSLEEIAPAHVFLSCYTKRAAGKVHIGKHQTGMTIRFNRPEVDDEVKIRIGYASIMSIIIGHQHTQSTVSVTMRHAPKFYHRRSSPFDLAPLFAALGLREDPMIRVSDLDPDHMVTAPVCFVYRFVLSEPEDLEVVESLAGSNGVPAMTRLQTISRDHRSLYRISYDNLLRDISTLNQHFRIAYQLTALLANGVLHPQTIADLIPTVKEMNRTYGANQLAFALRGLRDELCEMSPDPTYQNEPLTIATLLRQLHTIVGRRCDPSRLNRSDAERTNNGELACIHSAYITPAGRNLEGPRLEDANRVLRRYAGYHDYFLRRDTSLRPIYQRFKDYLSSSNGQSITIGLRQRTVWQTNAKTIIEELGDFSGIRNPGKYAARIGQAFSNTTASIEIPVEAEWLIPDVTTVERVMDPKTRTWRELARVFSDGCGTISMQMVERIWKMSCKGVISLDSTLEGECINLRKSMVKFTVQKVEEMRTLEICSTTSRPLPMFLNRPLIKILEDLGVPDRAFLDRLQEALAEIRGTATDPSAAARFLRKSGGGVKDLGMNFMDDEFLRQAYELVVVTVVRDIKYRARIEIPDGYTLMGVMDETGFLEPEQVFIKTHTGVLVGRVVITRAPAMHPGDVQFVEAVNVPRRSPLHDLRNCVVFSQRGTRDMPSKLSGGDLDGDLYNVIMDSAFFPIEALDLQRPVTVEDMADFFIDFMQNDMLGLISSRHLVAADLAPEGTLAPQCLELSEAAAIAVDFPKTGLPRPSEARPDFMSPMPLVAVGKGGSGRERIRLESVKLERDDNDDDAEDLWTFAYYESNKILGKLYRAVNEEDILHDLQSSNLADERRDDHLLLKIYRYGCEQWSQFYPGTDSEANIQEARELQEAYDDAVLDLATTFAFSHQYILRELEVFCCIISGKGKASKRQRDLSEGLRERFHELYQWVTEQMGGESGGTAAFQKSLACLESTLSPDNNSGRTSKGRSFGWIAAAVLLSEIAALTNIR